MRTPESVIADVAKTAIEMPGIAPGLGEEGFGEEAEAGDENVEAEADADADDTGSEGTEPESTQDGEVDASGGSEEGDSSEGDENTPADTSEVANRLAAIAEAEQEVRTTMARLKRREAELNENFAKVQEAQKGAQDILGALKADPFGTLEKAGVPFDSLLEAVHSAGGEIPKSGTKQPKADEPPAWAKQLMEKIEAIEGANQAATDEQNTQAYKQIIGKSIESDKYSVLRTMRNAVDTIYDIAAAHASQTGEILPVEVIADNLQEEWQNQLSELGNHEATRKLLNLGPPPKKSKQNKNAGRESEETDDTQTSLSGDMTPPKTPKNRKGRTRRDAIAEAAKALDGVNPWGAYQEDEED
jgi:hypothetical protein